MIHIRLDKLLKQRHWTAYRLAKESEIHPNVVGKYRHNDVKEISLDTLNALCKALRCKAGELIEYVPDKKK